MNDSTDKSSSKNTQWQNIKKILSAALEMNLEERTQYIDKVCGEDFELRNEVESLLSFDSDTFMDQQTKPCPTLEPGVNLGRYKISALIGIGGMGEVYQAIDSRLDRRVAIKVLPKHLARDDEFKLRFEREAKAISLLNHPNICTLYDVGNDNAIDYLVMEFIKGETLADRMLAGPLPLSDAIQIGIQVADGLRCAHAAGIVHRDLKPANVMLTDSGVKLLDFGIAKQVDLSSKSAAMNEPQVAANAHRSFDGLNQQITKHGAIIGTAPYMAPEQALGKPVGPWSDQYSFGAMLREIIFDQNVGSNDQSSEQNSATFDWRALPKSDVKSELSNLLREIVTRCTSENATKRYESISAVRVVLKECESLVSPHRFKLKLSKRLAAAILLLSVLSMAIVVWQLKREDYIRWSERESIMEINVLTESGAQSKAFHLVHKLHTLIPQDQIVNRMLERITIPITINTEPSGADVYLQEYANETAPWVHLGQTPLEGVRIPYALMRWKIEKDGYANFEGAPFGERPFTALAKGLVLDVEGSRPVGMVRVPGGPFSRRGFPSVNLSDYWLDRYEVSNNQFKSFIDDGGYATTKGYFSEAFADEDLRVAQENVLAQFVDKTGVQGPSTWMHGTFESGHASHPVRGVSWYEAAAYCRYVGKSLPTAYHWSAATAQDQLSDIIRVSNFGRVGPTPIGASLGLSDFGNYDMAGNVKEWVWNKGKQGRFILGGSWDEPTYLYKVDAEEQPSISRESTNGFRCTKIDDSIDPTLRAAITAVGTPKFETVTDNVFDAYKRIYSYDRVALDATVDSIDDTAANWQKESVSFVTAYGGERMTAHLFIPRNTVPPYQAVIWVPGNDAFFSADNALVSPYLFDFIPRNGRVLVYPVYKGLYERHIKQSFSPNDWRDLIVMWSKDLSRTLDYLETRPDINSDKIAYYGFSAGGLYGPIFTAVDQRFKASVLLAGGLHDYFPPEVNASNFAARSTVPTLMINGRDDFINSFEDSQKPLFELLGAPETDKKHARLEGGHIVPDRLAMVEETLLWLDHYLGDVRRTDSL